MKTKGHVKACGRTYRVTKDGTTVAVEGANRLKDLGVLPKEQPKVCTADLDIFQLCGLLGIEMSPEARAREEEYIRQNLRKYQNRNTMESKMIFGLDATGYPVQAGDTMYRKKNGEKYVVADDGSCTNASGKVTIKNPKWANFVHNYHDTDKGTGPRKEVAKDAPAAPAVEPAAAPAPKAACDKMGDTGSCPVWQALDQVPVAKVLEQVSDDDLAREIHRRNLVFTSLNGFVDREVADELRRRGYEVTATKTIVL